MADTLDVCVDRTVLVSVLDALLVTEPVGLVLDVLELLIVLVPLDEAVPVLVAVSVAVAVRVVIRLPDNRVDLE